MWSDVPLYSDRMATNEQQPAFPGVGDSSLYSASFGATATGSAGLKFETPMRRRWRKDAPPFTPSPLREPGETLVAKLR